MKRRNLLTILAELDKDPLVCGPYECDDSKVPRAFALDCALADLQRRVDCNEEGQP